MGRIKRPLEYFGGDEIGRLFVANTRSPLTSSACKFLSPRYLFIFQTGIFFFFNHRLCRHSLIQYFISRTLATAHHPTTTRDIRYNNIGEPEI